MGTRDAMVQAGQIEWWQTGVIYHIYLRSFKDTSGDGVGDLRGIIEQLDYLGETLGVDALWVSPFYPSPQKDFGYDINDFTAVDPLFGDLATFDALVGQMHRRALKLIIDYVPNHTSDQHPWFAKSRASRDNPKRGWYVWADPKPDGSPPNNWTSETGGSAWAWDATTAQYYLHSHYPEQPDLNWRNPAVKAAMFDVLRFWLERGVDGFRIDVAHMIMKDPALRDNPPNPEGVPNPFDRQHPDFSAQRHVHDRRHPDLHAVYREMRALLDAYSGERPRMAIGEIEVMPWDDWIAYFGAELDELHLPFNFGLIETPWTASAIRASVDALERALPAGAWPNYVLGNHDRARLASRVGPEQARVAAMLLLTLRGTPTLYYGDELGMADAPIPPALWHDSLGRDAARTPLPWTDGPHAGFSAPSTPALWLPVAPDYRDINVTHHMAEQRSMLALYRRLLAYRRATPALRVGSYEAIDGGTERCYIYARATPTARVIVALNLTGEPVEVRGCGWAGGKSLYPPIWITPNRRGRIRSTCAPTKGSSSRRHTSNAVAQKDVFYPVFAM